MNMALSSDQLEAFGVVAREAHFSKAAKILGITQSALSLRIQKLEDSIGATLFIRGRAGVRLTHAGQELLRYANVKSSLESEVLGRIADGDRAGQGQGRGQSRDQLRGMIRIGGFSSVMRSLVLPAVAPLIATNPHVSLKLVSREVDELPGTLQQGEVDFLLWERKLELEGVESIFLGNEINVVVQSRSKKCRKNVFLDHDERDQTTLRFMKSQSKPQNELQRLYLDDIYGIIDGVVMGLGRAVLPKHLAEQHTTLEVDRGFKAIESPVYLNYYKQPYYSRLHTLVQGVLLSHFKSHFKAR